MLSNGAIGLKSECGTWILEAAKGGKLKRQIATNCDKSIAAFCRFLSLGFESHFFPTITLGDGVCVQTGFPSRSLHRLFPVAVNVGNCRRI
jgi:hypothetical protein